MNRKVKYFFRGGGGGVRVRGDQGRCERRSEVFCENLKICFGEDRVGGGGVGLGGQGGC